MARTVKKPISAITGRFVKSEYAKAHPDVTVVMKMKVGRVKHRK